MEGLIGSLREEHRQPGPENKDNPHRLLNPEKHLKQKQVGKGKEKKLLFARNSKLTFMFVLRTCVKNAMLLESVLEIVDKNIMKRKFYSQLKNFLCVIFFLAVNGKLLHWYKRVMMSFLRIVFGMICQI